MENNVQSSNRPLPQKNGRAKEQNSINDEIAFESIMT